MKLFRKIISAFCILAIILSTVATLPVAAADTAVIFATDSYAYKGSYCNVDISAENLNHVGALDITVYYDSTVLIPNDVYNGYLVAGCSISKNMNTVGVAAMSILCPTEEGLCGNGTLFSLSFFVKNDCTADKTVITVAVGDAYNVSLQEITVQSRSATLQLKEFDHQPSVFYVSSLLSSSEAGTDETVTVQVMNMHCSPFSSGDFTLEYDRELFSVESAVLDSALQVPGAVYSVNTNIAGLVKISYAATADSYNYNLFSVTLRTKHTQPAQTVITVGASEVYDNNRTQYAQHSYSENLTLTAAQSTPVYPAIYTVTEGAAFEGQTLTTKLCLDADSALASGDFRVSYDPDVLACTAVEVADEVFADNGIIVLNTNYTDGEIKFSYVNESGTTKALTLLHITWEVKENTTRHYSLSVTGKSVTDANYNLLTLQYRTEENCVLKKKTLPPDCLHAGAEYGTCTQKEVNSILLPANTYPESEHPYENNTDKTYSFSYPNAAKLFIKFSQQTLFEHSFDNLYVYDKNMNLIGFYSGEQLAGAEITVHSDSFTLQLQTDGSVQNYGFSIDSIYAENTPCDADDILLQEIPALGHSMVAGNIVAPTCTQDGYTVYTCENGCQMTENRDFVPAAHQLVSVNAQAPTCTQDGWNAYEYCTACDHSTYEQLPADGHKLTSTVTAPTCTQDGYTTYTCSVCGHNYVADQTSAHGHDYDGVITSEPTCTATGIKTFTCRHDASHSYTETLAVTEHNWTDNDCTSPSVCITCGHSSGVAIGHTFSVLVNTVEKTCTTDGYSVYRCIRCDETEKRDFIPAAHTLVSVAAQAPTCTQIGWEAYEYCTACTHSTYVQSEIDENNHVNTVPVAAVPPTATDAGYTEGVYCNDCRKFISGHEEIPSLRPSFTDSENAKRVGDRIFANNSLTVTALLLQAAEGSRVSDGTENTADGAAVLRTDWRLILPDGTEYVIVVLGDVDCDGTLTASDARLALRTSVKLENFPTDSAKYKAANIDGDAAVSASDARAILRASVKLDDPCGWLYLIVTE